MASCKFEGGKYKGATEVKAHMRHNDISPEMRAIAKKKNKHIDLAKCKYNFSLLGLSYEERCKKYDDRIAYLDSHGNKNKRKDRVTMQCIEVPVPGELPRDRYRDWLLRVADIIRKKYGEENFIDADMHFDEEHTYREPQTKELVVSRVHGHYMFVPEADGKLNAKKLSLRKNMKLLNLEVEEMTKQEFGCSFMTGKKTKRYKKVEELKIESENAELLFQMEQERQELDARRDALDAREDALDEKEMELQEKEDTLERREKAVQDLEKQKEATKLELEAVRKKGESLDEAVRAVTEMPTMDEALKIVLNRAVVEVQTSPESPAIPYVAMRYLEHVRNMQREEAELACRKVKKAGTDDESSAMQLSKKADVEPARRKTVRKAPDYTFRVTQPDDGMEF